MDNPIQTVQKYIISIVPFLICLGFLFSLIQKIVRFAYYKVDILYLVELRVEEILQGLAYLFIFIYSILVSIIIMDKSKHKNFREIVSIVKFFIKDIVIILILLFCLWYAQTNNIDKNQIYIPIIVFFIAFLCGKAIFSFKIKNIILYLDLDKKQKYIPIYNMYRISIIMSFFIIFIILIQWTVETTNTRFTYIIEKDSPYVIISTFRDRYITKKASIYNDTIIIYESEMRLINLDRIIYAHQFKEKKFMETFKL